MVLTLDVPSALTRGLNAEVEPLLKDLGPYSVVAETPRILALRNPAVAPAAQYDAWAKNYRFGRNTSPTSASPAWKAGGAIAEAVAAAASRCKHLVPFGATLIDYDTNRSNAGLAYHRDPSAYTRIASFTLTGEGRLLLRHGGGGGLSHILVPGNVIVMEEVDCLDAKHSVTVSANGRRGLVVRFVSRNEMKRNETK